MRHSRIGILLDAEDIFQPLTDERLAGMPQTISEMETVSQIKHAILDHPGCPESDFEPRWVQYLVDEGLVVRRASRLYWYGCPQAR